MTLTFPYCAYHNSIAQVVSLSIHIPLDAPVSLKAQTLVKSEFVPRNVSRDPYTRL
ncbi:MAG: hypothetical protein LBF66_00740 [Holosporales bacterium]|nr:hypothetical protein [Holosporales bacterium]